MFFHNKAFLWCANVKKNVGKNTQRSHTNRASPCVKRIPTVFFAICDAKKNVSRAKSFPNKIPQAA